MILYPYLYRYKINDTTTAFFHPLNMAVFYCRNDYSDSKLIENIISSGHATEWLVEDSFCFHEYAEDMLEDNRGDLIDIKTLKMFTTTRCNLNCTYCLIEKNLDARRVARKDLSLKDGLWVLNKFSELALSQAPSAKTIMLYGGEPMMNKDNVLRFIQYIRENEADNKFNGPVEIVLESNGTLITNEVATFLRDHNVFVIVSIDGVPDVHNQYRKTKDCSNSYSEARRGFDILIENGCTAVISSVFTDKFAENVDECIHFMTEDIKPKSMGLNLFHVLEDQEIENDVTEENYDEYIHAFELARSKGLYIEHIMRRIRPLVDRKIRIKDCGACGNRIVSDVDGNIGICEGLVGNTEYFFKRNQMDEVKTDPVFVAWAKRTPLRMKDCLGCPAMGICGAGCVSNAIQQNGDIYTPDKYICGSSKAFIDWALRSWYLDNCVEQQMLDGGIHHLSDEERVSLLGVLGREFQIPLQNISKQYEVKGEETK